MQIKTENMDLKFVQTTKPSEWRQEREISPITGKRKMVLNLATGKTFHEESRY